MVKGVCEDLFPRHRLPFLPGGSKRLLAHRLSYFLYDTLPGRTFLWGQGRTERFTQCGGCPPKMGCALPSLLYGSQRGKPLQSENDLAFASSLLRKSQALCIARTRCCV